MLDYVVVKVPRFAFEKFAGADPRLTTQMKSVGESMAIGRTFKEAFQKGLRALESGRIGLGDRRDAWRTIGLPTRLVEALRGALRQPTPERIFQLKRAMLAGIPLADIHEITGIDPVVPVARCSELVEAERWYAGLAAAEATDATHAADEADGILRPRSWRDLRGESESARARRGGGRSACGPRTRWSIPAPASSRRRRRISTGATTRRARRRAAGAGRW